MLDLFAGTGALGIEALSRGAAQALFVDAAREAIALIRRNLEHVGFSAQATIWQGEAGGALARAAREGRRFETALLDPPYAGDTLETILAHPAWPALLAPQGRLVAERPKRAAPLLLPDAFVLQDERVYGETRLCMLVLKPTLSPAQEQT